MLLKCTASSPDPTFGFTLQDDYLLKRYFVKTIKPKYLASKIISNPRSTKNNLIGVFVTSIHGACVFTSDDDLKQLCLLHKQGVFEFSPTFSPENKLPFKEVIKAATEYVLFYPNNIWYEDDTLDQIRSTSTTTEAE